MSSPKTDKTERNLSRHQFPTLMWIRNHRVTVRDLRGFHGATLGSLGYNGYIAKIGGGEDAEVQVTQAGEEALRQYTEQRYNQRQHAGDITERCMTLLRHVRRVRVLELKAS